MFPVCNIIQPFICNTIQHQARAHSVIGASTMRSALLKNFELIRNAEAFDAPFVALDYTEPLMHKALQKHFSNKLL